MSGYLFDTKDGDRSARKKMVDETVTTAAISNAKILVPKKRKKKKKMELENKKSDS